MSPKDTDTEKLKGLEANPSSSVSQVKERSAKKTEKVRRDCSQLFQEGRRMSSSVNASERLNG